MLNERIERAEVFVVGPDTERYTWAEGMSDQYMVNIILRLTTGQRPAGHCRCGDDHRPWL